MVRLRSFAVAMLVVLVSVSMFAQATGSIRGRVTRDNGSGIAGVIVSVEGRSAAAVTDPSGEYAISSLPPGSYTLSFGVGDSVETQSVEVTAGQTVTADRQVAGAPTLIESVTVYSASRQTERIVEAPAAVVVVTEQEISAAAASGQLPKVLESAPGVDSTQSGLYDFNFNTRGFNSSLNRRILTLVDGRDPAIAFLGAQEWAALSFPLDEMGSVELVRGPGSALYGPNAFNGVLNMTTKQPRLNQGGKIQLSGGDLDAMRIDAKYAGGFANEWFYRLVGGYTESGDFARSRNIAPEYSVFCTQTGQINCLPRERALELDESEITYGGLRLDKHFANSTFTIEGGYADLSGPVFQTGIGRVQVTDVQRPWARMNYNMRHFNFLTYYDGRKADNQIALSSGAGLYEDSSNIHAEIQGNYAFFNDKVNLVGGVAYREQEVDTANGAGVQTLMPAPVDTEMQGVFAQLDIRPVDRLRFVLAGRFDDSTLHDSEFSPKASIVYEFIRNHSVRLTYNKAFQVPNYSEFFLSAPAGAPTTALNGINEAFKPALGGGSLGFDVVPILARGNDDLIVEHITGNEIGYSGIFGGKLFMTADYYQNEVEDFVTDLLPGTNPDYPFYAPPANLPPQLRAAILAALQANVPPSILAGLTNLPNGRPAIVFSYTNAGTVDTKGLELSFNYYASERWLFDMNYSWFDFEVQEQRLGDKLFPNAPEHKYNLGVTFTLPRFDISAKYRWVDDFFWAAGVFAGDIESYDSVSLSSSFRPIDSVTIGATVSNALDNEHYEAFGGDIIERRALGYVSYSW